MLNSKENAFGPGIFALDLFLFTPEEEIMHLSWALNREISDFPPRATSLIGVKKNLPRKFSRKVQLDLVEPPVQYRKR